MVKLEVSFGFRNIFVFLKFVGVMNDIMVTENKMEARGLKTLRNMK